MRDDWFDDLIEDIEKARQQQEDSNGPDTNLRKIFEGADSVAADMASDPVGHRSGSDAGATAGAGNGDRAGLARHGSEQAQIVEKQDTRILTNQNSNVSDQRRLWTQKDGSVKATIFEGERPREVIVRPKKSAGNFDQSKIEPGILTNQKSRRGRPRNPDMPPVPGQYYYWKKDGNGLSLSYEPPLKNANGKRVGQDYQYQGFLLPTDWEHLKGKFDEQTILSKIRAVLKIKRFRTLQRRKNRGGVTAKRGEPGRGLEAS